VDRAAATSQEQKLPNNQNLEKNWPTLVTVNFLEMPNIFVSKKAI